MGGQAMNYEYPLRPLSDIERLKIKNNKTHNKRMEGVLKAAPHPQR